MKTMVPFLKNRLGAVQPFLWMNGGALFLMVLAGGFVVTGNSPFKRLRVIDRLFYDNQPIYDQPYLSVLTHFSEVLWCLAAVSCLFAWAIARSLPTPRRVRWFLLCSSIGLLILMADDLLRVTLLLHVRLGVPRLLMYGLYSLATVAYIKAYRKLIAQTPYGLLLLAIAWFTLSGLTDSINPSVDGTPALVHNIVEEAAKLLGCLHIALYFWQVSLKAVHAMIRGALKECP